MGNAMHFSQSPNLGLPQNLNVFSNKLRIGNIHYFKTQG